MKKFHKFLLALFASACFLFHYAPWSSSINIDTSKEFKAKQIHKKFKKPTTLVMLLDYKKIKKVVPVKKTVQKKLVNVSRGGDAEVETVDQQINNTENWFDVEISFYTDSYNNCQNTLGITASGKHVNSETIATPSDIPFGTPIYIRGQGLKITQDRGGAIRYKRNGVMKIDIFVEGATQKQLLNMGIIKTKAKIIKNTNN